MKNIVETTGSFMLIEPLTGVEIRSDRPTVVSESSFISTRISKGQLKLLAADIGDEKTDEDFAKFWDENPDIAVEAFLSVLDQDELLEAALADLQPEDLEEDGKPKLAAMKKALPDLKVTKKVLDEFWAARG